jgi:hypothetical protein
MLPCWFDMSTARYMRGDSTEASDADYCISLDRAVGAQQQGLRDREDHGLALGRTFVLAFVILLPRGSRSWPPRFHDATILSGRIPAMKSTRDERRTPDLCLQ